MRTLICYNFSRHTVRFDNSAYAELATLVAASRLERSQPFLFHHCQFTIVTRLVSRPLVRLIIFIFQIFLIIKSATTL